MTCGTKTVGGLQGKEGNQGEKALQMNTPLMYRYKHQQPEFVDFYLPFGGHLHANNRWVRLAALVPWQEAEQKYAAHFADSGMGAPAKSVRIALGALLIKERLGLSDEERRSRRSARTPTCNTSWALKPIGRSRPLKPR